jgi:uncharacterized secreted protein with C-terminal beta-propeller domain
MKGSSISNNSRNSNKAGNSLNPKGKDLSVLLLSVFAFMIVISAVLLVVKVKEENGGGGVVIPSGTGQVMEGGMKKFKDYKELGEFLDKGTSGFSGAYSYLGGLGSIDLLGGRTGVEENRLPQWGAVNAPSGVPTEKSVGGGGDYSTTNIQVAGVDEGDIVKTDGKYIYAISGNDIAIIEAYPVENSAVLSKIKLDSRPAGIYINKNKLIVYGQSYNIYKNKDYQKLLKNRRNYNYTFLKIFNVSDKSNPKEEKSFDFEGSYVNSRMIGDYVYFITSTYNYYSFYNDEFPIPVVIEDGEVLSNDQSSPKCNCPDVYYFDIPYKSYNFVTVSAVNVANSKKKLSSEVYLLDGSQNSMFVSKNNIYITFSKFISEEELVIDVVVVKDLILPKLDKKDRNKIAGIEKVENYILSPQEKIAKVMLIIRRFAESLTEKEQKQLEEEIKEKVKQKFEDISKELEKTIIHKIAISGSELKYEALGEVPGMVLNQFSMDESQGYFRIATTKNRRWSQFSEESPESYSNLYVLDKNMKVVGRVEKLAKGERIYSVRFMQDRAYLVTFRQTDPLLVIDLKNPTSPQVLGELKVPGFSSYLHPYDSATLIGLGKEADENGRITGGIKLSLFDVSDVKNPREIDKYVMGDRSSNSMAINDHKAFLFSRDKNLLVIPVRLHNSEKKSESGETDRWNRINFFGAAVFRVDKNGFELKGKIDHSADTGENSKPGTWGAVYNTVKRSLYIESVLYTLSDKYLKANELDNLTEIKSLDLSSNEVSEFPVVPMVPTPATPIPNLMH